MRRAPALGKRGDDRVERQPRGNSDRGSSQRVVHREPPECRDDDRPATVGRAQVEGHAVRAARGDVICADVGVGGEPVSHRSGDGSGGHPADALVVGVQDRDAVRGQCLDELALRLLDGLDGPDP